MVDKSWRGDEEGNSGGVERRESQLLITREFEQRSLGYLRVYTCVFHIGPHVKE